jgi:hypothetical protein
MPLRWPLLVLFITSAWTTNVTPVRAADDDRALSKQYLALYTQINDADEAERKGDYAGAVKVFQDCCAGLAKIRDEHPYWETALVIHRLEDCQGKLRYLQDKVSDGSTAPQYVHFQSGPKNFYPWKKDIISSLFWIGENPASAWNQHWTWSNGGPDSPAQRNGYTSARHAADLNPFYVALPFNDLAFPAKAQKWLPAGWARTGADGQPVSACQNRWIEIKNARGDVCYAQWEDVGPGRPDDVEYVFGSQPPRSQPGICISPAVGDYLNLKRDGTVSWRFVDTENVQPGAWLKYDEEAVLFRAMRQGGAAKMPVKPVEPVEL